MRTLIEHITTINLALSKIQDDRAVVKFDQGTENASTMNDQVQGHAQGHLFSFSHLAAKCLSSPCCLRLLCHAARSPLHRPIEEKHCYQPE